MGCNGYVRLKVMLLDKGEDASEETKRLAGEFGWYVHEGALGRMGTEAE